MKQELALDAFPSPAELWQRYCQLKGIKTEQARHTIEVPFVKLLIHAPSFIEYTLKKATGTTIKILGLKAINDMPVALPPLSEQHRIVAKVDDLMAAMRPNQKPHSIIQPARTSHCRCSGGAGGDVLKCIHT